MESGYSKLSPGDLDRASAISNSRPGSAAGNSNNKQSLKFARVLYDYIARDHDELTIEEEDIVGIISTDSQDGWYYGENGGLWGFFPKSYIQLLTDEQVEAEGLASPLDPQIASTEHTNNNEDSLQQSNSSQNSTVSPPTIEAPVQETSKNSWFSKHMKLPFSEKKTSKLLEPQDIPKPIPIDTIDTVEDTNTLNNNSNNNNSNNGSSGNMLVPEDKNRKRRSSSAVKNFITMGSPRVGGSTETKPPVNSNASSPVKHVVSATQPASAGGSTIVSIVGAPALAKVRWIDYIGSEQLEKLAMSKKEIQRQEVIYEIYDTEKDYVEDLEIIVKLYINGFKQNKLLRQKDLAVVFSNVEQLLNLNKLFLGWIENRANSTENSAEKVVDNIGDLFIDVSDYLKIYTMYCSNHPYALMKLQSLKQNKGISRFLDQCAVSPESRNLNLANFLLKPVQRICKYPLLVREVIKNTDEAHKDYENLVKALQKIEVVVGVVNEGARNAENVHKMLELQNKFTTKISIIAPSRKLLKHGPIELVISGEKKKREIYLFNDMFILAKPNDDKLKAIAQVNFQSLLINNIPDSPGKENIFEIVDPGTHKFLLQGDCSFTKQQWLLAFSEATENYFKLKTNGGLKLPAPAPEQTESTEELDDDKQTSLKLSKSTEILGSSKKGGMTNSGSFNQELKRLAEGKSTGGLSAAAHPPTRSATTSSTTGASSSSSKYTNQEPLNSMNGTFRSSYQNLISTLKSTMSSKDNLPQQTVGDSATAAKTSGEATPMVRPPLPPKTTSKASIPPLPEKTTSTKPPALAPKPSFSAGAKPPPPPKKNSISRSGQELGSSSDNNKLQFRPPAIVETPPSLGRLSSNPFIIQDMSNQNAKARTISADPLKHNLQSPKRPASNGRLNAANSTSSELNEENDMVKDLAAGDIQRKLVAKRPVASAILKQVVRSPGKSTKDFTYLIKVTYHGYGATENIIRKTYDDFFEFHMQLLGHFPQEAGLASLNGEVSARIIPELPGQMMFVSEVIAKNRMGPLQEYIQNVLSLPPKIKRSPVVLEFFHK